MAGRFWLRHTFELPSRAAAVWLATWFGKPTARKWEVPFDDLPRLDASGARGSVDGAAWELRFDGPARPYSFPHPLARPLAKTRFTIEEPSLTVNGWIEVDGARHELVDATGHRAHVWGTRHADLFVWSHANVGAGRWVELVAARVPQLPVLAAYATERGAVNAPWRMPFVGRELSPERSRIGPYEVSARPADFVGVTYEDPDGTPLFCYHTERAHLSGPDVEAVDVAYEFATRTRLEGWTISI